MSTPGNSTSMPRSFDHPWIWKSWRDSKKERAKKKEDPLSKETQRNPQGTQGRRECQGGEHKQSAWGGKGSGR